jgi:hypothetical protein
MRSSQGPIACEGQRSSDRHADQQKWESEASAEGQSWNGRGEPQREASPATLPEPAAGKYIQGGDANEGPTE